MAQITFLVGAGADCQYPATAAGLLAAWAAIPNDVIGSGNSYRLELDKTAVHNLGTTTVTLTGKTTDAAHGIWIGPRAGHGFGSNPNVLTNAYTYNEATGTALKFTGSYTDCLVINNDYVTVTGLQVSHAGGGNSGQGVGVGNGRVGVVIDGLIIKMKPQGQYVFGVGGGTVSYTLTNTLIILDSPDSNGVVTGIQQSHIENVTVVRPSTYPANTVRYGFTTSGGGPVTIKNCLSIGSAFSNDNATVANALTGSNNASDGVITFGTNNKQNLVATDVFVDPSGDFRTKANAVIIDAGVTPSTNNNAPSGVRQQGSSADIGAWEYPSPIQAPSATVTDIHVDGQTVTISGTTTGTVTSGNASITPSVTPYNDSAVAQGPTALTLGAGTFSVVFNNTKVGSYGLTLTVGNSAYPSISGSNQMGGINVVGALATSVVQDPIDGQILTIHGTTSGNPTSGSVLVPAAATNPNGAASKLVSLTLGTGTFTVSIPLTPGNYDAAILRFTTAAGASLPQAGTSPVSIMGITGDPQAPDSGSDPTPIATVTSVTITPTTATGATQFTAVATGTNNPPQSFNWSTVGGGSVDNNGNFTPPAPTIMIQTVTVTATSTLDANKKATATVTIAAVSSGGGGTPTPTPDTTAPVCGAITLGAVTTSSIAFSLQPGTDNVGITKYDYNINGGAYVIYTSPVTITGLQQDTLYTINARAYDAANNVSAPVTVTARTAKQVVIPPVTTTIPDNHPRAVYIAVSGFAQKKSIGFTSYGKPRAIQDPNALLDYVFDWTEYLAATGSTIVDSSFFVSNAELGTGIHSITKTLAWVKNGTAGKVGILTNRVTTNDGRTDERSIQIKFKEQ